MAKATFAIAIALASVSSLLIMLTTSIKPIRVEWSGAVLVSGCSYGIMATPSPYNRPTVVFFTPHKTSSAWLMSFNDVVSYFNGTPISHLGYPKIRVANDSKIIIDYTKFKKVTYVYKDTVYVELLNFTEGVLGLSVPALEGVAEGNGSVRLLGVKGPFMMKFDVVMKFTGCKPEVLRSTPFKDIMGSKYLVQVSLRCNESSKLEVIAENVEDPLVGKLILLMINYWTYSLPLIVVLIGVVLWYKWLSKNLEDFKGVLVFISILILLSGLSGHHWDLLMALKFGEMVVSGKDLYQWTYNNTLLMRDRLPNPQIFYPGYAYLPQLAPFFVPIYLAYESIFDKPYYYQLVPGTVDLAEVRALLFGALTFIYYVLVHGYFMLFYLIGAFLIYKFYGKDRFLLSVYSFLPIVIIVEWGMFEAFLIPFLVASLILLREEGNVHQLLSGLAWGMVSSKIYAALAAPALILNSRRKVLWLLGFIIAISPSLYFLLTEPKTFLSCTLLFHTNRNMGDVNYYPSFMGNPVDLLWWGKVGSAAEVVLTLLTYYLVWKLRPSPEVAAATVLVPYLLFNRLVSPQHYLTFATLVLLSGDKRTYGLLSLLILLHVNLVRPTAFYLAYHWLSAEVALSYFSYDPTGVLNLIVTSVTPSVIWPFLFPTLAGVLTLYYYKSLSLRGSKWRS